MYMANISPFFFGCSWVLSQKFIVRHPADVFYRNIFTGLRLTAEIRKLFRTKGKFLVG